VDRGSTTAVTNIVYIFYFFVIRNYFPKHINRLVSIMHAQCVFVEAINKSINII